MAGKILTAAGAVAVLGLLLPTEQALALPVDLGTAADFALLEIGPGSANVSISQGGNVGFINGDIGIAPAGKLGISAGNFPISGTVYAWQSDGINTGGNAPVVVDLDKVNTASSDAMAAWNAAKVLASSGGGVGMSTISVAGGATLNLTPGVYNLANFTLGNGAQVILAAGGSYVFNISSTMKLDHAQILNAAGLAVSEILFNFTGDNSKVATSGGLDNESIINGIILAPYAPISLTPGLVNGEIIGGDSINIASGGAINGTPPSPPPSVPDAGSSLVLMSIGLGCLAAAKRKFIS